MSQGRRITLFEIRYRSEVEASWATFFDMLGTPYEYEPHWCRMRDQGWTGKYLCDFYLPKVMGYGPKPGVWVEVKGPGGHYNEYYKQACLSYEKKQDVYVVQGDPADVFKRKRMTLIIPEVVMIGGKSPETHATNLESGQMIRKCFYCKKVSVNRFDVETCRSCGKCFNDFEFSTVAAGWASDRNDRTRFIGVGRHAEDKKYVLKQWNTERLKRAKREKEEDRRIEKWLKSGRMWDVG
jgi:hypothetical protein